MSSHVPQDILVLGVLKGSENPSANAVLPTFYVTHLLETRPLVGGTHVPLHGAGYRRGFTCRRHLRLLAWGALRLARTLTRCGTMALWPRYRMNNILEP